MTTSVPTSALRGDKALWPRQDLDHERVALFADLYQEQGPGALPPIIVLPGADDTYILADGWHRTRAALAAGLEALPAEVVELTDQPIGEAVYELAVRHSVKSSRPLKRQELQAAILRLAALHPDWSQHVIGKFVGVSHTTVGRVISRNEGSSERTEPSDGDGYIAAASAQELASRLFRGIEKVYEARGLGLIDSVVGDRTAERLAGVIRESFGDDALVRAQRYRTWIDGAIKLLRAH